MVQDLNQALVNFTHHLIVDGPVVCLSNLLGHSFEIKIRKGLMATSGYDDFMSFAIFKQDSSFKVILMSS